MSPLRALLVAFLQQIAVIATFALSSYEHLVAPEQDACHAQLTCYNLSALLEHGSDWYSDTIVGFLPGNYTLTQKWVIANASNLTLMALVNHGSEEKRNQRVVFDCEEEAGLIITLCDHVRISGLTFVGCGLSYTPNVTSRSSSLLIIQTLNVTLYETSVHNAIEDGLVLENSGDFSISKCTFIGNTQYGMIITYTNASGMFKAVTKYSGLVIGSVFAFNGRAGLFLHFVHSEFLVEVVVSYAEFYTYFGIYHIEVNSSSCWYTIEFNNFSTIGGGTAFCLKQAQCESGESVNPTVRLHSGELQNLVYCGVCVSWFESVDGVLMLDSMLIHDIDGVFAYGVYVVQNPELMDQFNTVERGLILYLKNLSFWDVHGFPARGIVVYIESVPSVMLSDVSVSNNTAAGLVLVDSTAYFTGDNLFHNNSSLFGGGIGLWKSSVIVFFPPVKVNFTLNRADTFGGAIFISNEVFSLYCSLQQPLNAKADDITLYFSGNEAGVAGPEIYGELIDECDPWDNGAVINARSIRAPDLSPTCGRSYITSDARRVYLCHDLCPTFVEDELQAIPGQSFSLTVVAMGQGNGSSPGVVRIVSNNLIPGTTNHNISAQCTTLSQTLQLTSELETINISLSLSDPFIPSYVNIPRIVQMTVLPCPAGFQFSTDNSGVCDCNQLLANVTTSCNIVNETVTAAGNPWIAYDTTRRCITVVSDCPLSYCESDSTLDITQPDQQCAQNRSGVLCGRCKEGFSLQLDSDSCQNCSAEESQWRIPVYVLLQVALAFGVIAFMIGFDLTVSAGSINGPLFFISVVEIYEKILFPSGYVKILLDWFALNAVFNACIDRIDACGRSWIAVIYSIFLVLIGPFLVFLSAVGYSKIFSRCPNLVKSCLYSFSGTITKFLGTHAISVLAIVFLLTYTRLFLTSIETMYSVSLMCCDADAGNCTTTTVWFIDGNVQFLGGCHLPLFIVSVTILIVFLLFTTLIISIPCQERYISNRSVFRQWHMLLKPWYDAYGAPYKDTYRSWTGFLLLVRCILGVVVGLANDTTTSLAVLSLTCLFLSSFVFFFPIYKHAYLNSLELLSFASLSTMATLSAASNADIWYTYSIVIIFNVVFFSIIIHHISLKLMTYRCFHNSFRAFKTALALKVRKERKTADKELDDKEKTTPVPTTTVDLDSLSLREPQLEESRFNQ